MDRSLDKHRTQIKYRWRALLALPPLLFLAAFYFYPLADILKLSFTSGEIWDISRIATLFTTPYYAEILWFTTWQAALSTVLTLLIALPSAYVFARYGFKGKSLLQSLMTVPFVLPTVVTAAAFQALLGGNGLINQFWMELLHQTEPLIRIDQTVWFFLIAHVFYNYAVVLRIVGGFWSQLPLNLSEAASMLGASRLRCFIRITLPLLMPSIIAASALVFTFCFTSFGVVLILGGPRLATLEVEIFRQAVYLFQLPVAAVLSLIQILFTFVLMWIYTRFEARTSVTMTPNLSKGAFLHTSGSFFESLFIRLTFLTPIILIGTPIAALFSASIITRKGIGLTYYSALFTSQTGSILYVAPIQAVLNSLEFAFSAMILALILGWFASAFLAGRKSRIKFLDPLFMLPLSTSAVTLGFGFIIALDAPPLNLRSSLLLPVIAHAMVGFPFVIRCLLPAIRAIPQQLRDAAAVLGASPFRVWFTVDRPVLQRAFIVGAAFAFAISMGEFGATVFVARPRTPTLPLAIYRFLTVPGTSNYGQAMAMSCILMLTTAVGFIILEKISQYEK